MTQPINISERQICQLSLPYRVRFAQNILAMVRRDCTGDRIKHVGLDLDDAITACTNIISDLEGLADQEPEPAQDVWGCIGRRELSMDEQAREDYLAMQGARG